METEKKLILVLPELCTGCKSCEYSCAVEHSKSKDRYFATLEKPSPIPRIRVLLVDSYTVPMRCQHCSDAPCLAVCPTKAISQTPEGFILINDNRCIGCFMCAEACPFGAIKIHPELKIAVKCDFCVDRVRAGLLPACVEACPTGALKFGTINELMSTVASKKAKEMLKRLASEGITSVFAKATQTKIEETISPTTLREMYQSVGWV
ncbi:carbon monoxide dehydrogenase, electron transfer subunit CooF [Thermofilum adornatum 1505]|uniref:Carbon monoxide dehydrogenase, electron transfer subunit CooF n=1 Tax=Thermofilum adornatum 1505 TaxID=697581 RepID=A0A3G1A545_9CREN|nr:4Fe-4S dicluster domain-containing protein [Thermofilum adornatum]AJB41919.1 carbon monoxide dehydrogenase, electron transfer subunit CooF [Thermofilum adornatum 1505]